MGGAGRGRDLHSDMTNQQLAFLPGGTAVQYTLANSSTPAQLHRGGPHTPSRC